MQTEQVHPFRHSPTSPWGINSRWQNRRAPSWLVPLSLASLVITTLLLTSSRLTPLNGAENDQRSLEWHAVHSDTTYRIESQEICAESPHQEGLSEAIRLESSHGTYIHLARPIPRALIIDELNLALWIRSDRPGLQVLARVVLPRSLDPQTGEPLTTLIRGSMYHQVGEWQQLTLDNLPLLLSRHVRVLRSHFGPQVDEREAYIDQILVNAYGGAGLTTLWLADTEVDGHIAPPLEPRNDEGGGIASSGDSSSSEGPVEEEACREVQVDLHNSVMTVAGRPFFPRAIEHNGEAFAWLAERGFNSIMLSAAPTRSQLLEAEELGLWIISPPPIEQEESEEEEDYGPVIAWNLGEELTTTHLEAVRQEAYAARQERRYSSRPFIAAPDTDLFSYSCSVDLLLLGRHPLGTSLKLADYLGWLEGRQNLARPGTPSWIRIQTEVAPSIQQQLAALTGGAAPSLAVEPEQIRSLVYAAIASKGRGIIFASQSRLDTNDPQTRLRATALELINLELYLIDPWIAGSAQFSRARCSDPQFRVDVLQTDRSRLLLPLPLSPHGQHVAGGDQSENITLVAPGVPEANAAYLLRPTGLKRFQSRRVTGGIQLSLDAEQSILPIMITHDPLILSSIAQRQEAIGRRAALLRRDLAHQMHTLVENVDRQIDRLGISVDLVQSDIVNARQHMYRCDNRLVERDLESAEEEASSALYCLARARARHWHAATLSPDSDQQSAFASQFPTLPYFWKTASLFESAPRGENRLPGGAIEGIAALIDSGWSNFRDPPEGVMTDVNLERAGQNVRDNVGMQERREGRLAASQNSEGPLEGGQFALRMRAWSQLDDDALCEVATPPVWITTAPVTVDAGEIVEIRGWVYLPEPITGSQDGLIIFDSLGGQPLAHRIYHGSGWSEFVMIRAVDHAHDLTLTLALSGLGEAWVDNLSIRSVALPAAQNRSR